MAAPKKRPGLVERTPATEWAAAALGLILTLALLGYLVREGVTDGDGPPVLMVTREAVRATAGGYVVPVIVRNESDVTAAEVELRGALAQGGQVIEERRATFSYVPAGGEARGGLVFQTDPAGHTLSIQPEGYELP